MYTFALLVGSFVLWIASEKTLLHFRQGGVAVESSRGVQPAPRNQHCLPARCAGASPPPQPRHRCPLGRCLQPHRAPPVLVPAGLRHWRGGGEMAAEHRGRGHDVGLPQRGESAASQVRPNATPRQLLPVGRCRQQRTAAVAPCLPALRACLPCVPAWLACLLARSWATQPACLPADYGGLDD